MFHILNSTNSDTRETFGFKTSNNPPQMNEIRDFENDLFDLVSEIKYRPSNNSFQKLLKSDQGKISKIDEVIVPADKSPNLYKMSVKEYKKKTLENITKTYKKCSKENVENVSKEAAVIARRYKLEDRIEIPTEDEAFITIKDHKESFPGRVECRLINPAKNHIGKISKHILDRVNSKLRSVTASNQWKNTNDVIEWFCNLENKNRKTFLKFDIVSFYPSISEKLMSSAISWAKSITNISDSEVSVIMHCRKMFLFYDGECWVKKSNPDFDVSMGSLDSAEVCELVGLYILQQMEVLIPQQNLGLYRDDGLAVVELSGPETDQLRKKIVKLFAENDLQITTDTNTKVTDFLDVVFNLDTSSYKPYRKDNSLPIYVHRSSNHPPHIKKQLPKMIGSRISDLSENKEIFSSEAPVYNQALKMAGYDEELQYSQRQKARTSRKRKVLWFNPPWNDEVSTNVAKKFLSMVEKHFPRGSQYHKYFNRNTVKVSYCTMPNMAGIIAAHNKKVTRPP